jgi:MFS transporter, DHA1 family, multidrug resistance protein
VIPLYFRIRHSDFRLSSAFRVPHSEFRTVLSSSAVRKNLFALTAASFIGFTGFTLVMPFLPLYIAELGVRDVGAVAAWTGICLGITPALTALLAPAWGRVADRFGRKLLVVRSLVSFVVLMTVMAFATRPWHLLVLRAIQGIFAGYGALCLAMAADSSPPDRLARSIGIVQTAQRLGPAAGPVLGGVVAGLVGLRNAFFVTAVLYAIALVQLVILYKEPGNLVPHPNGAQKVSFREVLAFENVVILVGVIFGFQFVDRSFGPVLPLQVAALGVAPDSVAVVSGVVFSVLACAAAVGHHFCASLLARWSARRVIARGALSAAAAAGLFALARSVWWLGPAAAVFGFGVGAAMTAAYTTAATVVPAAVRGTGFGVLTSASLAGMALSPVVSGIAGATDIRLVFAGDAAALCVLAVVVRHVMVERTAATAAPEYEDA